MKPRGPLVVAPGSGGRLRLFVLPTGGAGDHKAAP